MKSLNCIYFTHIKILYLKWGWHRVGGQLICLMSEGRIVGRGIYTYFFLEMHDF